MGRWFTKSARRADGDSLRLARVISKYGLLSRRLALDAVAAGRVTVNGKVVTNGGLRVSPESDRILLDGREIARATPETWMLNKPAGVLTTARDPQGRKTVYDLLPEEARKGWLFPVGRLDNDSAGLLLFTNDTPLGQALTGPEHHVPKTYRVKVAGPEPDLTPFQKGMTLDEGEVTRPAVVRLVRAGERSSTFDLVLTEGKNRQIRRMCGILGLEIELLVRTHLGPLALGELKPGAARRLTEAEVAGLRQAAGLGGTPERGAGRKKA
ncbi:MAG: rRNA pseudouridine synthase [Planctomycetes bacterium]|nr:rRNA pseudouridine synthase [Planctomycetota bacterium]